MGFEVDVMTLGKIGKWGEWLRDGVLGGDVCRCLLRWVLGIQNIGDCGGGGIGCLSIGG